MVIRRLPPSNELYHHGVKGQRWGIRRYQNKDGSLTSAGKKQYGVKNTRKPRNYDTLDTIEVENFGYLVDPSLKPNQVSYKKKKDPKTGKTTYDMTFKDADSFEKWYETMGLNDLDLSNENESLTFENTLNYNMSLLQNHGTLEFDTNSSHYNPDFPLTAYTNISAEEMYLPGIAYMNNEVVDDEDNDESPIIENGNHQIMDLRLDMLKAKAKVFAKNLLVESLKECNYIPLDDIAVSGPAFASFKLGKAFIKALFKTSQNHSFYLGQE